MSIRSKKKEVNMTDHLVEVTVGESMINSCFAGSYVAVVSRAAKCVLKI